MYIKKNKSIELKNPIFTVDTPINNDLEKYDVLQYINRSNATAFIGTSGSGKTSLMYSFLMNTNPKIWKKQFESLIVVMPHQSRMSLKNNIFDKYLDENHLYDVLDEFNIEQITQIISMNADEGYRTLLILDDVASQLKNPHTAKKLQHLIYAYRHYKLVVLMLVQTMKTIPLSIRKNLSNIVVFYKPRLSEWEAITSEFLEMDKDASKDIYNMVFKEKYDWCLINLNSQKIFQKFNEIIYKSDAEEER